jgi:FkbM family methyltransferase
MTEQQTRRSGDDRDLLLKVKLLLPEHLWRIATRPAAWILRALPVDMKYGLGLRRRRNRHPYCVIRPGDVVFQIGVPSDLLEVGRSRAAYFLHIVSGGGRLVIMEPDKINCDAFEAFATRIGMRDKLIVVPAGGWSETKELKFYQSREHPASAVLAELSHATGAEMARRGYHEITVPVTTVDEVVARHGLPVPRLVSITTNGAEVPILDGMKSTIGAGLEYVSLAITDDGYVEEMTRRGYRHEADDDRGFTFRRSR